MKILILLLAAAAGFSGGLSVGIATIRPAPHFESPVAFLYEI